MLCSYRYLLCCVASHFSEYITMTDLIPFYFRQLIFSHQQSLVKSLEDELDHAMALHIVAVLLFHRETSCIIHLPGKFIPTVISFLSSSLSKEKHDKLLECQHLISAEWKAKQLTSYKAGDINEETGQETQTSDREPSDNDTAADSAESELVISGLIKDLKQLVIKRVVDQ